jgi:hypothetical protein
MVDSGIHSGIISVYLSRQLKFEGSHVSGFIKLDAALTKELGITSVKASLRAVIDV